MQLYMASTSLPSDETPGPAGFVICTPAAASFSPQESTSASVDTTNVGIAPDTSPGCRSERRVTAMNAEAVVWKKLQYPFGQQMAGQHTGGWQTVHAAGCQTVHAAGWQIVHAAVWQTVHAAGWQTVHAAVWQTVHAAGWQIVHATGWRTVHRLSNSARDRVLGRSTCSYWRGVGNRQAHDVSIELSSDLQVRAIHKGDLLRKWRC